MRAAIMGVGSLGTILGAYISKAGYQIDLIDPYKEHVDTLNKSGAHIIGTVDFTVPVHAITPDQMTGVYDIIFYMAKQTYNDTAIPQIEAHISDTSTVCVCQNGIPEYAVSEVIGVNRTVGATVGWGATFQGPGCSMLTSTKEGMVFNLGSVEGPINDRVLAVKKYLECLGEVVLSEDLMGIRWTKLLMNATFSGLSTALGTTFGGVIDKDDSMKLILRAGKECLDVAAYSGVTMAPYEQYDFYEAFKLGNDKTNQESIEAIRKIWMQHYNLTASMAQDLIKGRKCEIFAINGVVCNAGKKVGIPTPVNDKIVEVVFGIQEGKYKYEPENIKYFKDLLY